MDNKEKVLTLASAARKVGIDPEELRELIHEGRLDAVETEGGNLLIGEESLKGIIKEIETTELAQQEHEHEIVLHDDIRILLSQAANFIERQEEELQAAYNLDLGKLKAEMQYEIQTRQDTIDALKVENLKIEEALIHEQKFGWVAPASIGVIIGALSIFLVTLPVLD